MDTLNTFVVFLMGVGLRLIVPLALTALVVIVLHRLDARWQAEAKQEREMLLKNEMPCSKDQSISAEQIKQRLDSGERPCWQTRRLSNGHLRDDCLTCDVFRDAPVPAAQQRRHGHAHV